MMTTMMTHCRNENDITGYTPYGARARDELDAMKSQGIKNHRRDFLVVQVAGEFFSKGGSSISVFVLILPKDGGNVLREDVLKEGCRVKHVDHPLKILQRE
ncbi:hypothetical protein OSTOST_08753, partial [Ostertagia ostertagi]